MKFSQNRLLEENDCHSLDIGYKSVTQRHREQLWKYKYPRHIKPPNHTLSKNDFIRCPIIISQGSESVVVGISKQSTTRDTINNVNQNHLESVCKNLERQLKKAKIKGDKWLINVLEKKVQDMEELCIIHW